MMGTVAVIGEPGRMEWLRLAGALVLPAGDAEAVRSAWAGLGDDVSVVILSSAAAAVLGPVSGPVTVVLPEVDDDERQDR
ncbi:hypothetical protein ACFFMN_39160 [Planobispora siamensis]|uniref:Uncharacterized protein n=1 Tax=Planobispora siamensis TaxID=936338 RepID=A0A8J3WNS0_9ACTN|nr:hypothetical protein [Planobispora siamensis]GIH96318.1 hypothetical protein Psi01_69480 [Planobispora siamensis]